MKNPATSSTCQHLRGKRAARHRDPACRQDAGKRERSPSDEETAQKRGNEHSARHQHEAAHRSLRSFDIPGATPGDGGLFRSFSIDDALKAGKRPHGFSYGTLSRSLPEAVSAPKPRLRACPINGPSSAVLVASVALVGRSAPGKARIVALVLCLSLANLFGTSALYHRIDWSPASRKRLRRLDHAAIFILIAGGTRRSRLGAFRRRVVMARSPPSGPARSSAS